MTGHYRMHRGWLDHPAFGGDREPYCRRAAWAWLIENACWKPTKVDAGGTTITVGRGQLCYSYRFLAKTWGWSVGKVQLFFDRLKTDTMINTVVNTGRLVVTICNYDKYQAEVEVVSTADNTVANTPSIRRQYKEEEGKKERRKSNGKDSCVKGAAAKKAAPPPELDIVDIEELVEANKAAEHPAGPPPEPAPPPPTPTEPANVIPLKPKRYPLPPDWWPPGEWLAEAAAAGHRHPALAAMRFFDHWRRKAAARNPYAAKTDTDWKAAFLAWIATDVMKGDDHGRDDGRQGHRGAGPQAGDGWARLAQREIESGFGR